VTVFFARFVFGMRILAGPLAGVLRMKWRDFAVYNFLGAALWVTVISSIGYLFGRHWGTLVRIIKEFDFAIGVLVILLVAGWWWRKRQQRMSESE
jgi:membrane protein DedA with SNARE-associated domain